MTEADRAQLHRPHDRDTLRVAAHELLSRGLTPRDIGSVLQLSEAAVCVLLDLQTPAPPGSAP